MDWRTAARWALGGALATSLGCTFDPPAGQRANDGGPSDGALSDLGLPDLGRPDAVFGDASKDDAGAPLADTGPADATLEDGGPVLGAPTIRSLHLLLPANTSTVVQLWAWDPEGRALTFRIDTTGTRGQATLAGDALSYEAPRDAVGEDQLLFYADNGTLSSTAAMFRISLYDNRSCLLIRDSYPGRAATGLYLLDTDGAGRRDPFVAWCEMEVGGGGWTLVARSVAGAAAVPFGWRSETGAVDDDSQPYSIDAEGKKIAFDRMLAVSSTGAKSIREAYRLRYDSDFYGACTNSACGLENFSAVQGPCATSRNLAPTMLLNAGRNQLTDHYFFRDQGGDYETGLRPDGWNTFYNACIFGGGLNGEQGMIFVRCEDSVCTPPPW